MSKKKEPKVEEKKITFEEARAAVKILADYHRQENATLMIINSTGAVPLDDVGHVNIGTPFDLYQIIAGKILPELVNFLRSAK